MLLPLGSFAQVNLDSGLVAYYAFNGNAEDSSGNGNDGTLLGGANADSTLKILPNDSSVLQIPYTVIDGATDFAISFRFKINAFNVGGTTAPRNWFLSGARTGGGDDANAFLIEYTHNDQRLGVRIEDGNRYEFGVELEEGRWYCFLVFRAGNQITLEIDGISLGTKSAVTQSIDIEAGGLFIGQDQDCLGGCFDSNQTLNGEMDDLRFYDRMLTTEEKVALCQQSATRIEHQSLSQDILLSPNPASGAFSLTSPTAAIESIALYDLTGRRLPAEISHDRHEAQVRSRYRGLALVKVQTDQGMWVQKVRME